MAIIDDVKVAILAGLFVGFGAALFARHAGLTFWIGGLALGGLLALLAYLLGRTGETPNGPLYLGAIIGLMFGAVAPLGAFFR